MAAAEREVPDRGARRECRVVICDDQAGFRRVLAVVLAAEPDFVVVGEAADGEEAVRVVGDVRPDVLLLDIAMPVMDGLEALPRVLDASPETQVVMLTGVVSETVRRRALDGGACLFLEKGVDIGLLADEIRRVCGASG